MRNWTLVFFLAALCLGAVACNDDPVTPQEFAVTFKVVDTAGDPVEGLRVGLVNDCPYFQDGQAVAKAAVAIQFRVVEQAAVRIAVKDIEGREIRVLIDDTLVAGDHRVMWGGRNFEEVHQPSGRYTVHMVVRQLGTGDILFQDSTDMFLAMLDSSRVPAGYTDDDGKLVLKDKKLFPHLYDRPPMIASDENGENMGILDLTPTMRISLVEEGFGSMWFRREITAGAVVELVWSPPPPLAAPGMESTERDETVDIMVPPDLEFRLGPVFPNPFN